MSALVMNPARSECPLNLHEYSPIARTNFLHDVDNDLIRETRGTDMPMLVHATKEGTVHDPRFLQPTQHGTHGTRRFVPAVWNADLPALMQLIRLALVHGLDQTLRGQRQVRHVQPDKFTAAHGSGEAEQQHRLVARSRERRRNQLHDLLQVGGQQRSLALRGCSELTAKTLPPPATTLFDKDSE